MHAIHRHVVKFSRSYSSSAICKPIKLGRVSPVRTVPNSIRRPCYADSGQVTSLPDDSPLLSYEQLRGIREAAGIVKVALDKVDGLIRPGITGDEIDREIHDFLVSNHVYPAPLNYMGFPKSLCLSPNEIIVHGIPDSRPLEDGDIGYFGDSCRTYLVGDVDEAGKKLVQRSRQMLWKAIAACGPGVEFSVIGDIIDSECGKYGYGTVQQFCGHGVGKGFHMSPLIHHWAGGWNERNKEIMKPGQCFTIEPMITEGSQENLQLDDGWSIVTVDQSRSSQFEHMVLITETGVQVLT
eukprot:GSMAST32.ASY1.ANO1.2163.1 assembled CDS